MSVVRLSSRYAKSLIDLSREMNKLEDVHKYMLFFHELTEESREFQLMLKSPIIKTEKKVKILEVILLGRVDELTLQFIRVFTDKRREPYLIEIATSFIDQYNLIHGITRVHLSTPAEINKDVQDEILSAFKLKHNIDKVDLTKTIDEELIGGFILQFDDKLYDASVARQLELLKKDITDTSYIKNF